MDEALAVAMIHFPGSNAPNAVSQCMVSVQAFSQKMNYDVNALGNQMQVEDEVEKLQVASVEEQCICAARNIVPRELHLSTIQTI